MTLTEEHFLIRDPQRRVNPFSISPKVNGYAFSYKDDVIQPREVDGVRLMPATLLQHQMAYEQSLKFREGINLNKGFHSSVCANVIINNPESKGSPVFVDRPAGFVYDEDKRLWTIKEGPDTRFYTRQDGFEMPDDGWYVPILIDPSTPAKGLMLYHHRTGMPLETISESDREKAVNLLVPYLQQTWNIDKPIAREFAQREISFFQKRNILDEVVTSVDYLSSWCSKGPRCVGVFDNPRYRCANDVVHFCREYEQEKSANV